MTWQGGGAGTPGEPPEEDTQVAWPVTPAVPAAPAESPTAPPLPPAPPPAPATPASTGPGGYTYPAEIPAPGPGGYPSPGGSPPPGAYAPLAAPPSVVPDPGGYPPPGTPVPPGGTWQPPQVYSPQPGRLKFGGVLPRLLAYWLDSFLVSIIVALVGGVLGAIAGSGGFDSFVITTVLSVGTYALYFIGFWTGGGRATPGMRLFHLQVGQAADGRTLTVGQALVRWAALGYPFSLLGIVPWLALPASGLLLLWEVLLLASTAMSPTRQGLHDRLAGSAMVAPEGNEGPVIPCLVVAVILLVVLPILALVALIAIGTQVQQILTEMGGSI